MAAMVRVFTGCALAAAGDTGGRVYVTAAGGVALDAVRGGVAAEVMEEAISSESVSDETESAAATAASILARAMRA